jgi:hypothetical protein
MQDFFGIKIDTATMTLEELEEAQKKVKELYSNLSVQISLRKLAEHKHSSSN